jgi:hypothetical protein
MAHVNCTSYHSICMINTLTTLTFLLLFLVLGSFCLSMHGRQTNRTICTSICARCHLNFKDASFKYVSAIQTVLRGPGLAREKMDKISTNIKFM